MPNNGEGSNQNAAATTNDIGFIKPPKPLVVSGDISKNWSLWIQQYEWFEIATNMKKKSASVQVATFMSSIGIESVMVFNTVRSYRTRKRKYKRNKKKIFNILYTKTKHHI